MNSTLTFLSPEYENIIVSMDFNLLALVYFSIVDLINPEFSQAKICSRYIAGIQNKLLMKNEKKKNFDSTLIKAISMQSRHT